MPDRPTTEAGEQRIRSLLDELTREEKVSLLSGQDFWSTPAVERLGIPSLTLSDGPTGLRSANSDPATVFPVAIALAATWDIELVEEVASGIGREAIDHGVDVLLAPGVNIQRSPLGGRNFEYFSEDPHLTGRLGIAVVNGVQSVGVGASVKHFAANNQEHNRMSASSNVSERALREVYLAAFEAIVNEAEPWTVMSAYNRINGIFASEHDWLLNGVLKKEWGFDGVVVSDWGAAKSTVASANGGLDLEMPGPARFYGDKLLEALADGAVSEEVLDEHVLRVLRLIARCGLLDDNPKKQNGTRSRTAQRRLAQTAATRSAVLLKNDGNLLPLGHSGSIAVIGALADCPAIQGGGSSQVSPERIVTPLEGLRDALPASVALTFERGVDPEPRPPVLDGRLLSPGAGSDRMGLQSRYFSKPGFAGEVVHEALDWRFAKLGFGAAAQDADGAFSVEWTGIITPRYSGENRWQISHSNPDVELIVAGQTLVGPETHRETEMLFMILPLNRREAAIHLDAGKPYPITIRYSQPGGIKGFNIFNVAMREPEPDRDAALASAQSADTAIVFVGSGTTSETEGQDRASMALSDSQNELVEEVVRRNKRTVVVVNTGGPIEMPWADKVAAIVQLWLPGQEGGHAIASVLTGKSNPSGKLPITFPRRLSDNPTYLHYPGGQQVDYGEGIFVGYRYYSKRGLAPLFPFGHGLSYTQFELSEPRATAPSTADDTATVSVLLTNTGDRAGAETVQLYLENCAAQEAVAPLSLCGFRKQELSAGESTELNFSIPQRAFAYYDVDAQGWICAPGSYRIHIGTSVEDLPISLDLVLAE